MLKTILTGQNPAKVSPLKDKPPARRRAGNAARGRLEDKVMFTIMMWAVAITLFFFVASLELMRKYRPSPPMPALWFTLAVLATVLGAAHVIVVLRQSRREALGIKGEEYIGECLERSRVRGFEVLHDVPGSDFNVDHILIGPEGIFSIETKTISKPKDGPKEIDYDGNSIVVPGCPFDRDPLIQARAGAAHIRNILKQANGESPTIRPVLLFTNWFIIRRVKSPEVWVLTENHLEAWLDREEQVLSPAEIARYAEDIARHSRQG